jgi:hypothetical protein
MRAVCFVLFAISFLVCDPGAEAQRKGEVFDEAAWNFANEFIMQYHSQWPIRRAVIVYHPYAGRGMQISNEFYLKSESFFRVLYSSFSTLIFKDIV